jgi:hypothetical protein
VTPHNEISSSPLLFNPSWIQIFFSDTSNNGLPLTELYRNALTSIIQVGDSTVLRATRLSKIHLKVSPPHTPRLSKTYLKASPHHTACFDQHWSSSGF